MKRIAEITKKLGELSIPGFRSGEPWKMAVATLGYLLILLILITPTTTNTPTQKSSETIQPTPVTTVSTPVATVSATRSSSPFLPGTEAHLDTPILVATSESAYDELLDAFNNGDEYGLRLMMVNGEIFPVDDSNTKVLVLENSWFKTKIRILTGEYSGSSGWVGYEKVIT